MPSEVWCLSCPKCAAESERVPEHPRGRTLAKGEPGYEAAEAVRVELRRFRAEHPHCDACSILMDPGHVEPLSMAGKCRSCAVGPRGVRMDLNAIIQLIEAVRRDWEQGNPYWASTKDGRAWIRWLGYEPLDNDPSRSEGGKRCTPARAP